MEWTRTEHGHKLLQLFGQSEIWTAVSSVLGETDLAERNQVSSMLSAGKLKITIIMKDSELLIEFIVYRPFKMQ